LDQIRLRKTQKSVFATADCAGVGAKHTPNQLDSPISQHCPAPPTTHHYLGIT